MNTYESCMHLQHEGGRVKVFPRANQGFTVQGSREILQGRQNQPCVCQTQFQSSKDVQNKSQLELSLAVSIIIYVRALTEPDSPRASIFQAWNFPYTGCRRRSDKKYLF